MLRIGSTIRFRISTLLAAHWWAFVASHSQWIRPVVFETVQKLLACRTPVLGCHAYRCPSCGKTKVTPHSCKSRFCSTCGKQATDRWSDQVLGDLLDVAYHHLVMSVPWQLRSLIAVNREVGLNVMVRAAMGCLKQWALEQHQMRMGIIAVIHTFGADLKWHPHVHLLVTEGGLSLDGTRWVQPYNRGWLMSHAGLKKMWRYHCLKGLREAHKQGELRFRSKEDFLKVYACFNKFLSRLYKLKWYVHIGASLEDPRATVKYIGRYTKRAVLAEYRITHYDTKIVRFAYKDYANGGNTSYKTLPVLAFLARLIRHIPDKHFKMVRYAGLFANRWKARNLELAKKALSRSPIISQPDEQPLSTMPWRQRQTILNGKDPLFCERCQVRMTFLGTIFGSHAKVAEYFEAAGIPTKPFHPAWELRPG